MNGVPRRAAVAGRVVSTGTEYNPETSERGCHTGGMTFTGTHRSFEQLAEFAVTDFGLDDPYSIHESGAGLVRSVFIHTNPMGDRS